MLTRLSDAMSVVTAHLPAHAPTPKSTVTRLLPPALQFGQWGRDQSFRLFDYGTAAANEEHYGQAQPPSIAGKRYRAH